MFLTEIFFQTIEFMDKEVCRHLWRSSANDCLLTGCSNGSYRRR